MGVSSTLLGLPRTQRARPAAATSSRVLPMASGEAEVANRHGAASTIELSNINPRLRSQPILASIKTRRAFRFVSGDLEVCYPWFTFQQRTLYNSWLQPQAQRHAVDPLESAAGFLPSHQLPRPSHSAPFSVHSWPVASSTALCGVSGILEASARACSLRRRIISAFSIASFGLIVAEVKPVAQPLCLSASRVKLRRAP